MRVKLLELGGASPPAAGKNPKAFLFYTDVAYFVMASLRTVQFNIAEKDPTKENDSFKCGLIAGLFLFIMKRVLHWPLHRSE